MVSDRRPTAPPATRPDARSEGLRREPPIAGWSTPICGSSAPANRTARATAARRRVPGGLSTRSAWPSARPRSLIADPQLDRLDLALAVGAAEDRPGGADLIPQAGQGMRAQV